MKILIISGLSGSGKSKAASYLEDMGFYIVDNMPAEMILRFADFCAAGSNRYDRVALVYDIRAGEGFERFFDVMQQLKVQASCELLFIKASEKVIIQRYKETRHLHPLSDKAGTLEKAVEMEIEMLRDVEQHADYVIDTSTFPLGKLKSELRRLFSDAENGGDDFTVDVMSFGYKHGIPLEADLVFDVRFLPNPFYIESLRPLTGLDAAVYDYVMGFRETKDFLEHFGRLLQFSLPLYKEEGKTSLVIGIGCTGGHHRSVTLTRAVAEMLRESGYQVRESHRDLGREI